MTEPDSFSNSARHDDLLLKRAGGWIVVLGVALLAFLPLVPIRAAITGDAGDPIFPVVWAAIATKVVVLGAALRKSPDRVASFWRWPGAMVDRLLQTPRGHDPPKIESGSPGCAA